MTLKVDPFLSPQARRLKAAKAKERSEYLLCLLVLIAVCAVCIATGVWK
jgi:hypothetical protein